MLKQLKCSEVDFVLACVRMRTEAERANQIRAMLQEELDWAYVLQLAQQQGLLPLLYWRLRAIESAAIPETYLKILQTDFYANARYNLLLAGELLKLVHLFEEHGLSVVPFKGPTLVALTHENLALRVFRDLDFLVRQHDIHRAKDILLSHGYHQPKTLPSREQRDANIEERYYTLVRHDGKVRVDLQWRLVGKSFAFALNAKHWWERLVPVSLSGSPVLTFPPEDLLPILCAHGAKHLWSRLLWISDVAELIRVHEKMDWDWVLACARKTKSERMLFLGLALAHDLLDTSLPEPVWRKIQGDSVVKSLTSQVYKRHVDGAGEMPSDFDNFVFYCRVHDGLQGRIRYCLPYLSYYVHLLTTPTDKERMLLPLPNSLFFLYYLFRPLRLMCVYARRPWQFKDLLPHRITID